MIGKAKIIIPAHVKKPDSNGNLFDEKAIKKAIKEFKDLPIVDRSCLNIVDGIDNFTLPNVTVVGVAKKAKYKKKDDSIEIDGTFMNVGMNCICDTETGEITFTDFSLFSPSEIKEG